MGMIGSSSAQSPRIDHIIVIFQENWSFDGLYGNFPGADGIANASQTSLIQLDRLSGQPLSGLTGKYNNAYPQVTAPYGRTPLPLAVDKKTLYNELGKLDTNFPGTLNTFLPYLVSDYIASTDYTSDIVHRYWTEQFQINRGSNNCFVTWSDNPGLVMSRYDASVMPEGLLAQQYTMCDSFFHSAFGGSFLNHQFLIAAAAPVYYDPFPAENQEEISLLDSRGYFVTNSSGPNAGKIVRDGDITPVAGDVLTGLTINGVAGRTITVAPENGEGSDVVAFDGSHFDKHYVVNTHYSKNLPKPRKKDYELVPSQNDSDPGDVNRPYIPTIGDLLDRANVTWKWYSGGWDRAIAMCPANPTHYGTPGADPAKSTNPALAARCPMELFQWHHQPLAYYDNYAPFVSPSTYSNNPSLYPGGLNPNSSAHLQDLDAHFSNDVIGNTLPQVSFVKFFGTDNEHPGYATLLRGQQQVADLVRLVQSNTNLWAHTAIIITYDEFGGRWDHVSPPRRDMWGPGVRVPCIVISPFTPKGYVDHTQYETASVLKTIEQTFGLGNLNERDSNAASLAGLFTNNRVTHEGITYGFSSNNSFMVLGVDGSRSDVTIPSVMSGLAVSSIGDNAFANQSNLAAVTIAPGVTGIGSGAFSGCPNLSAITMPDSVIDFGTGIFSNSPNVNIVGSRSLISYLSQNADSLGFTGTALSAIRNGGSASGFLGWIEGWLLSDSVFVSRLASRILSGENNFGLATKQNQSLNFPSLAPQIITPGKKITNVVTSSSGLSPVIQTSGNSAVATASNNVLTLIGSGSTTITASQAGNNLWNPISVSQTLIVNKGPQTLTFGPVPAQKFSPLKTVILRSTSSASLTNTTYLIDDSSVGSISNNVLTLLGAGTATITATNSGNEYTVPAFATQRLIVR